MTKKVLAKDEAVTMGQKLFVVVANFGTLKRYGTNLIGVLLLNM
jgi:hypothetical protein